MDFLVDGDRRYLPLATDLKSKGNDNDSSLACWILDGRIPESFAKGDKVKFGFRGLISTQYHSQEVLPDQVPKRLVSPFLSRAL
jgi:hypothetical protein